MRTKNCSVPAGLFRGEDFIGSTARIAALPMGYRLEDGCYDSEEEHVISGIFVRVSTDGKAEVTFALADVPGRLFKPSELFIVKIANAE